MEIMVNKKNIPAFMKFTFQLGRPAIIKWSYNKLKNSDKWDEGEKNTGKLKSNFQWLQFY